MRTPDIDIGLLRCFTCVADQGSFTAASHALQLSQSAVSLQIKRLEQVMGRRVFDRTSRSIVLTRDGELLLADARRILALNDEIIQRTLAAPLRGRLRVGIVEHFLPYHIPSILSEFLARYPEVQMDIESGRSGDLRASYRRSQLELLIAEPDGDRRPTLSEELRWTTAPSRALPGQIGTNGQAIRLALRTPDCPFREKAIAALQHAEIPYQITYTSACLLGVIAAAEAGLGVTVLGQSAVLKDLTELVGLPALGTHEMAVVGVADEGNHLTDTLAEFIRNRLPSTVTRLTADGTVASEADPIHRTGNGFSEEK
jgi:DNA-binding transcriptional LysR family regulator